MGEHAVVEGIKAAQRRPVGFAPAPVSKAAGTFRVNATDLADRIARTLDAQEARKSAAAVRRAPASPVSKGVRALNAAKLEFDGPPGTVVDAVEAELARRRLRKAPVDVERLWTGDGSDTLRKRAGEPTSASADGEALTLVKAAHAGGGIVEATGERRRDLAKRGVAAGSRRPAQALVDAYDYADRLQFAKQAGAEIAPGRVAESEQMVSALEQMPAPRAVFTAPPDWTDDARLVAAEAGAAELQAAAVEAAHGSTAWLDRLNMTALAKDFARNRRRMPLSEPPRVKS